MAEKQTVEKELLDVFDALYFHFASTVLEEEKHSRSLKMKRKAFYCSKSG